MNEHKPTVSLWECPSMIPVLLGLLKEKQKTQKRNEPFQTQLKTYQQHCHRWRSAKLNAKQTEWLQEIQTTLNDLQLISVAYRE